MKKSSLRAQTVKRTFWAMSVVATALYIVKVVSDWGDTDLVRVVYIHHLAPRWIDRFMALPAPSHRQCGVHVHVVAR